MAPNLLSAVAAALTLSTAVTANPRPVTVTKTTEVYKTEWKTRTETKTKTVSAERSASSSPSSPSGSQASPSGSSSSTEDYWPGWAGITHMVTFGDSYSTTSFNTSGAQPSVANPLGNPAYPGYTATNGPNWVDFLTTTYNKTFLETLNLAYGGATVDSALVAPYLPTVLSLKEQVLNEFEPLYASNASAFNWQASSTLFASFLGINDVGNAYQEANKSTIYPQIFVEYTGLMDTLYQSGARNFLFLNVPPVNRAPLTVAQGAAAENDEETDIAAWNLNVTRMAANLSTTYPDATTFVFDTNAAFTEVLDDPCSHPETCAYKNTTDYCPSYENGTPSWYTFYQNCSLPVDEYFWLNTLHPTFRMMNVTAQGIAEMLS